MAEMLVRLKRGKKTFEVLVNEGTVPKYRDGKLKLNDVVVTPTIFINMSKGEKASADLLNSAFETDDVTAVIDTILRTGDAQESAGERKDKMDAKRREVITTIQKNYVSPEGLPLPLMRIENALEQIRVRIDLERDAEHQVEAMAPKLMAVLPMKRAKADFEGIVTVPVHMAGQVASVVRKHARVQRETYGVKAKFEVEVFNYDLLLSELTKATNGDFEFEVVGGDGQPPKEAPAANADAKGRGKKKKKKKGN